jgi:hypothetical protein
MRTGSHINTIMKGDKHKAEYALFALMDTLPVTSISVGELQNRLWILQGAVVQCW